MGFLSGLLTAVAIVATVVSGGTLGIVAGALMAASYAASKGWLGGSVGKFFNSSTGHYLTMAVGLASAATTIMGNMSATAAASQSSTVTSANAAAEGTGAAAGGAGGAADMAAGNASLAAGQATLDAAPTVSGTAVQTMTPGGLSQYAGGLDQAGGGLSASQGLSQAQIGAANASNAQVAKTLGFDSNLASDVSGNVSTASAAGQEANAGQAAGQGLTDAQKAVNPMNSNLDVTSPNGGTVGGPPPSAAQTAQTMGLQGQSAGLPPPTLADKAGGFLSKAGDVLEKHPGLATVAGNALSGMASGAAQQKMMQEQIAANQWGNMQWQDPTQVSKLQSAAAQPIGVPVGYLNRAAAVRNLMNTSGGGQTAPISGQVTPQTAAPTVKPVGM